MLAHQPTRAAPSARLSDASRAAKPTSPPAVTISTAAPVQAEAGGRALNAAEAARAVAEG